MFIIDNQTLLDKWLLNALVQLPYSNGGVATLKTYIFIIIHFSPRTTLKITWLYMASRLDFYSFSGYYFLMATSVTLKSLSQLMRNNDLLALFYGQHIMTVRIWCSTWGKKHILLRGPKSAKIIYAQMLLVKWLKVIFWLLVGVNEWVF